MVSPIDMITMAADALGSLTERVAFVGGAATPLLVTDPAAPPPRPTLDVDVIIEIGSSSEYLVDLREALLERGFKEDTESGVICRWTRHELTLDVMPTRADILGFSCRWYPEAIRYAVPYPLDNDRTVQLATAPYFLATKLEAFAGRGRGAYDESHDIEDIVTVVDGRDTLVDEVAKSSAELRTYLTETLNRHLHAGLREAIAAHLPGDGASQDRAPAVLQQLERLVAQGR